MYAGQSAQQRSDARRRQFLDAGLEVLGSRGWARTTVRAVCDEANLSTRFFYEAFESLEDLVLELYDEIVRDAFSAVVQKVTDAGPDPLAKSRAGTEALVSALTDDPRRAHVVLAHPLDSPVLGPRRRDMLRTLSDIAANLGRDVIGSTDPDDPVLPIAATLIAGGVAELVLGWVDGGLDVTREELVDTTALLMRGLAETAAGLPR